MALKFSQQLDIAVASQIEIPIGIYWNMTANQGIIGLYMNRDECNYDENSFKSLLHDIERQAHSINRVVKTPIYTRRAKKAYYEREKLKGIEFLATLNEKNKVRQRMNKEIKSLMCIQV